MLALTLCVLVRSEIVDLGNVQYVDPFIGTRKYASWSHAGMIPSVATPFAMVYLQCRIEL
jgi:uncharacterized protein (DUF779 family)